MKLLRTFGLIATGLFALLRIALATTDLLFLVDLNAAQQVTCRTPAHWLMAAAVVGFCAGFGLLLVFAVQDCGFDVNFMTLLSTTLMVVIPAMVITDIGAFWTWMFESQVYTCPTGVWMSLYLHHWFVFVWLFGPLFCFVCFFVYKINQR